MKGLFYGRVASLALVTLLVSASIASAGSPGFLTPQAPMLTPASGSGSSVLPIITVGETLPNGYRFEAIPDGIGVTPNGKGTANVFVAHETSLVPFPYTGSVATCTTTPTANCLSDFDNAQVSQLKLHQNSAGVLSGNMAITSSSNYQRFCSSFIAGTEHGFKHPIFFANEEATDFISPPPLLAWPPDPSNQRQAGLVVALDTKNGTTYEIPGLGRMNHENTIVVPGGWNEIVAVTGDDTFSVPSFAVLHVYRRLWRRPPGRQRQPWAFRVTGKNGAAVDPTNAFNGANDYGDLVGSDTMTGEFIEVPCAIALGDQAPLENWSNANNVFQFIRVEDIAYDKNDPRIVYFADTGEPRAIPNTATGRLMRGGSTTSGPYMNGRIFKMVLNAADPKVVDSLTILIDADAGLYNNPNALHNPDNVDTSANGSLMIGEDPGSHNGTRPAFLDATAARLRRYDLTSGALSVVAEVDQNSFLPLRKAPGKPVVFCMSRIRSGWEPGWSMFRRTRFTWKPKCAR